MQHANGMCLRNGDTFSQNKINLHFMVSKAHLLASLQLSEISLHALSLGEENKTRVNHLTTITESKTQVLKAGLLRPNLYAGSTIRSLQTVFHGTPEC